MSDEGNEAINNLGGDATQAGGSPSPMTSSDGDLIPTIPTAPIGGGKDTSSSPDAKGEGSQEGVSDAKSDDEGGKAKEGDLDRFDKHPRFIELNERARTAETQLANALGRISQLEQSLQASTKPSGEKDQKQLPYKDISQMSDEDLLEWQQNDPKGYHANLLAQARHELSTAMQGELDTKHYESQIESTYNNFAKENPTFDEMWDRGELQRFMDQNPGHNAISAFLTLTQADSIQQLVEAETKKAVEEAEKRWNADLKAKRSSQVLGPGPSATGTGTVDTIPQELADTKKFGGLTSVLAKRSAARRAQKGGG